MSEQYKLKEMRKRRKLTQAEVAKVLNVGKTTYNQYESGVNKISVESLIILSGFYNVSIDYLVGNPHVTEEVKYRRLIAELAKLIDRVEKE